MKSIPTIVVVGSVNLDLVATVEKLPAAGETVTGARLNRFPGGKGANQALAARRLGANVSLIGRVGDDAHATEALALLREAGVDVSCCDVDPAEATGVALIAVAASGENHIVVAPGANRGLSAASLVLPEADSLICQLEVPVETLLRAAETFSGFFAINLAPARNVSKQLIDRADLVVVNETEAEFYGTKLHECAGLLAITYGSRGAILYRAGEVIAESQPPTIRAIDTTGAGDAFTAALTVALMEGQQPAMALDFACAAGAVAATRAGAQTSLPLRAEVEALLREKESA